MEISDERLQEIIESLELARDMRKARPADADKIAIALSHKLSHDDFGCDPKACAEFLLEKVTLARNERLSEVLGTERSRQNFINKIETTPGFKFFIDISTRAIKELEFLLEYIEDDKPDEFAVEFASFTLSAIDLANAVLINGDVLPLIQRGVYASDIASALETWRSKRAIEGANESFWHAELASRRGC
ncbi:hypothetical protein K5Q02_00540 [Pseudomonas sp. MM211]|uniref:hypothetical protein n=1 Tax=Pseudomonas sp. MM211 TaxID=2866808 RepID=UPI001CED8954|nr:hypothetical protein [Pseudomonas sp. MM211]UCJ16927.1 hypothetical protein K5Q02_00540 [Pseudomonas sp. MM211]